MTQCLKALPGGPPDRAPHVWPLVTSCNPIELIIFINILYTLPDQVTQLQLRSSIIG
jgi:hypothetical protein